MIVVAKKGKNIFLLKKIRITASKPIAKSEPVTLIKEAIKMPTKKKTADQKKKSCRCQTFIIDQL